MHIEGGKGCGYSMKEVGVDGGREDDCACRDGKRRIFGHSEMRSCRGQNRSQVRLRRSVRQIRQPTSAKCVFFQHPNPWNLCLCESASHAFVLVVQLSSRELTVGSKFLV